MLLTPAGGSSFSITLPSEQALIRFAVDVACALEAGDLVTLSGDLGAGKTTFARALIRYLAADDAIEVPSPTFTLLQSYELPRFPLVHADLFRLSGAAELAELGFDDVPENAVALVEWADRAAGLLSSDRFDIAFTLAPALGGEVRNVRCTGYGTCAARAERIGQLRAFLDQSGYGEAERARMQGDASTRMFERLTLDEQTMILMNAPPHPDTAPVRDGKSYGTIAHLADNTIAYVALAAGLRERNFSAPVILHADTDLGLIVMEDLGDERIVAGNPPAPVEARYRTALDLLVALHRRRLPETLPLAAHGEYRLPHYDMEAMLIEVELLLDWYLPHVKAPANEERRAAFNAVWREALAPALAGPATWVLRDYHSPNLLWLKERQDVARIGVLDFQDAVLGPPAYDVASLLQDARVDMPETLEMGLLSRYVRARRGDDRRFDPAQFAQLYATLAAQRASKILGIFARLDRRDGKPQYLQHIPRIWRYLQRSLAHPALSALNTWYTANVPAPSRGV
ncbi:MAG: tRNA (adenosine(37)-N6)-threonylcarbamoyltransferase complex ATPase subunit type 1 TsaE [Xanthobacteraceae bacterium]